MHYIHLISDFYGTKKKSALGNVFFAPQKPKRKQRKVGRKKIIIGQVGTVLYIKYLLETLRRDYLFVRKRVGIYDVRSLIVPPFFVFLEHVP